MCKTNGSAANGTKQNTLKLHQYHFSYKLYKEYFLE